MLAHGSSFALRTMSVPAVAVNATGAPPITALCWVTDDSALGVSFFETSADFSPGFSGVGAGVGVFSGDFGWAAAVMAAPRPAASRAAANAFFMFPLEWRGELIALEARRVGIASAR